MSILLVVSIAQAKALAVPRAISWKPPSLAAKRLQQNITDCIASSECSRVLIPPLTTFAFNSAQLNITDAYGLTINGGSSMLLFAPGVGVLIENSHNVVVGNLSVDYEPKPYSQATITKISADCNSTSTPPKRCPIEVTVHDGYPPPDPLFRPEICFYPACETKMIFFDAATATMRRPQMVNWFWNSSRLSPRGDRISPRGGHVERRYRLITQQMWAHNVRVGDVVAVAPRHGACTYQIRNCSNVTTHHVRIHGSSNMAFYELGGQGGHTYRHVSVTRPIAATSTNRPDILDPPTNSSFDRETHTDNTSTTELTPHPGSQPHLRYLCSNFDGLHSEGTVVAPTVTDSWFEHIGDDFFNVQNAVDIVLGVELHEHTHHHPLPDHLHPHPHPKNHSRYGHHSTPRGSAIPRVIVADDNFRSTFPVAKGTQVLFAIPERGSLWRVKTVATAHVIGSTLLTGDEAAKWWPLASPQTLNSAFEKAYGLKNFLAPELSKSFSLYALELDRDVQAVVNYTTFAQVNTSYGASFIGNTFHDGASRVGPLNSPHSTFASNTATGTMMGGLLVSAELTWLSGNIGIDDVNVTDNAFVDCCSYSRIGYPYGQCGQPASGSSTMVPLYNPAQSTDVEWVNNSYA